MLLRVLLIVVVVGAAYGAVRLRNRWRSSFAGILPKGLTLVEAADCRTCATAKDRLDGIGAVYRTIDVAEAHRYGITTLTVPVAVVGSSDGHTVMVRRGTAVVSDAEALVAAAVVGA